MSVITTNAKDKSDLFRYESVDGYETGGLLYFRFEGREMVAVIRDRSEFDKHLARGTSLEGYLNTAVSDKAYGAALVIEKLIPEKPLPSKR